MRLASGYPKTFLKPTTSSTTWTRHHEETQFFHDREISIVTLDITEESLTKVTLPLQKLLNTRLSTTSLFFVHLLLLAVRYSHCRRQHDASFCHSKPLNQIQIPRCPLYKLWLKFLSFIKGALLPKIHIGLNVWLLVMGVQPQQEIHRIRITKLRSSYDKNYLAENDIKFRKTMAKKNFWKFYLCYCGKFSYIPEILVLKFEISLQVFESSILLR